MPLVERIARPGELDRAAPVLLEKLLDPACSVSERAPRCLLLIASPSRVTRVARPITDSVASGCTRSPAPRASTLAEQRPVPDPHGGYVAVVAEHAQGAGIQQKVLPGARRQPEPARREHAQHVAVREQRDVARRPRAPGRSPDPPAHRPAPASRRPGSHPGRSASPAPSRRICLGVSPSYSP